MIRPLKVFEFFVFISVHTADVYLFVWGFFCHFHMDLNSVQKNTEPYMLKHLTHSANSTADEASY